MKQNELDSMGALVISEMEITDPINWQKLMERVDSSTKATGNSPQNYRDLYRKFKTKIFFGKISDGTVYKTAFWRNLVDADVSGLNIEEGLLRTFIADLLGEVLHEMDTTTYSEAERLNDEGYRHHHEQGWERAIELHDRAIERSPRFCLAWINKGIALKNLSRYQESIACYRHVIDEIDPLYKKAWYNCGVAVYQSGDRQGAKQYFEKAFEIDKDYEPARKMLFQYRCDADYSKLTDQEADIDTLKQSPQALQLYQNAVRLVKERNWKGAIRLLQSALKIVPDHPLLLLGLGGAFCDSGQFDDAEEPLSRLLALRKDHGIAWLEISRCYLERRQSGKALEATGMAVEYAPNHPMAWANRSSAFLLVKKFGMAMSAAIRALALDQENLIAMYNLGVSARFCGDTETARSALLKFIEKSQNPNLVESAKEFLRVMC